MHKLKAKILIFAALLFMVINLLVVSKPVQASFLNPLTPWIGGFILQVIPPTAVCPEIISIYNYSPVDVIDLYVAPGSIIFPNYDLFTTLTDVKGLYIPIPYPTCPDPVYPILMIGTS